MITRAASFQAGYRTRHTKPIRHVMNHFIVTVSDSTPRQAKIYQKLMSNEAEVCEWNSGRVSFSGTSSPQSQCENFWSTDDEMLYVHGYPCGLEKLDDSVFSKLDSKGKSWLPGVLGLSGACTIIYVNGSNVHVCTDKLGALPVFETRDHRSLILGSCFEHVCNTSQSPLTVDYSSVWEFLLNWSIRPPSTLFHEVKELTHSSQIIYSPTGKDVTEFSLKYAHSGETKEELATDLKDAILKTVEQQTVGLNTAALFLSGGFDSRVIGENCSSDSLSAVTVTDSSSNYETVIAKRIAADIGAKHSIFERDPDFYFAHLEKACLLGNGLSTIADCHFIPILDMPPVSVANRILTGCYVDYLFKGIQSDSIPRYRWKRLKAGTRLRGESEAVGDPFFSVRSMLKNFSDSSFVDVDELKERLERHKTPEQYSSLETAEDYWYSEHYRLFPFSREPTAGTRHMLAGATRWFPIMSSDEILDVYCRIPVSYKMDNSFWRHVVQQAAPNTSKHRNANSWVKANSGPCMTLINENAAAIYYRLQRYIDPHAAIGSTQNFNKAQDESKLYVLLLEEVLGKISDLGFDVAQQQAIGEVIRKNSTIFMLALTLIRSIELCSKKLG